MAQVEVTGDQLTVHIEGMDKLWTLKSRLEIPLAQELPGREVPARRRDPLEG